MLIPSQAPASMVASSSAQTPAAADEPKALGIFSHCEPPFDSPARPPHWTGPAIRTNISDEDYPTVKITSMIQGEYLRCLIMKEDGNCHIVVLPILFSVKN